MWNKKTQATDKYSLSERSVYTTDQLDGDTHTSDHITDINDSSVVPNLGSKIMGRDHTDTVCAVRDPDYHVRGWFIHREFAFVELCHGDNVKPLWTQVVETVYTVESHRTSRELESHRTSSSLSSGL